MNITGTWQGEYLVEEAASDKEAAAMAGHVITFSMDLKQGWLGAVSGTIQDDPRTGFPEPGTLKGKLKGNFLDLRKLMPVLRLLHEPSRLSFEKWAERRKVVVDTDRPAPPILQQATLSADGNSLEGPWKFESITIEIPGSYQHLVLPTIGGTWRASRKV